MSLTSFGKMTSERFLLLCKSEQVQYGREVAESYRDEVVLPRGGCGHLWRNRGGGTGSYICEMDAGHADDHRSGMASCPRFAHEEPAVRPNPHDVLRWALETTKASESTRRIAEAVIAERESANQLAGKAET